MDKQLKSHLDKIFAPYADSNGINELKEELLADLTERFGEYKNKGYDEETAFCMTIDSIGNIEEVIESIAGKTGKSDEKKTTRDTAAGFGTAKRRPVLNLSASNLEESDFAGVTMHNGKFLASALRGSDFSGADLTGSAFKASDVRQAIFNGTNLTDCKFTAVDLTGSIFRETILVRTNFVTSSMKDTKFTKVKLIDAELTITDLSNAVFDECIFEGVNFGKSDIQGLCLDGQTFIDVRFDNAGLKEVSFRGATLKNVSFRSTYAITNKYYRNLKTISFDGAMIDKLTAAVLKGVGVDLSNATII